jgi:putative effector of murein hydrolase LrgA (UPF0299 family)
MCFQNLQETICNKILIYLLFVPDGLAVMSVDLGSEFIKIAIVKVMSVTDKVLVGTVFTWYNTDTNPVYQ